VSAAPLPRKTRIVSRRKLLDELAVIAPTNRAASLEILRRELERGRREIYRRLDAGAPGAELVAAMTYLTDQLVRVAYDHTVERVYPAATGLKGERLGIVAVGGYGRGDLAPYSDVDLLFLLPWKPTPWLEQVIEHMLYLLWDLGLTVGHAVRSVDDTIRRALADMTIRTSILEARYLWGDRGLYRSLVRRFDRDVVAETGREFVRAKLDERDQRHERLGDSRYVLEPNVKEGKGGLRDLHTLYWIAKYLYRVRTVDELVEAKVLTKAEYRRFAKAQDFLWRVRCHLHRLNGRHEDRLTFDTQTEVARMMGYADRPGVLGVERFMKYYFLNAKDVGDLTRIFAAAIEDAQLAPRERPWITAAREEIEGFAVDGGRLAVTDRGHFRDHPRDLIRLFHVAQKKRLDIHPRTLWLMTQNVNLVDQGLREDTEANRLFVEILTGRNDPEGALRVMNEAGVMGRFVPDFGRVVAQMQHDMYHVYTVDEHSIRAIGVLAAIERGEVGDELPLATRLFPQLLQRRVLYLSVLLHDIAKGRGGDHSQLGAEVAEALGPRLGFTADETETVAWLVRWHLLASNTAFRRDVEDPKTVEDFVKVVQSLERLRLLLVLTVADIRAVSPHAWNGWKGQLLRELYYRAEEMISGGHGDALDKRERVAERIHAIKARLAGWDDRSLEIYTERLVPPYWLAFDTDTHERHARLIRRTEQRADETGGPAVAVETRVDTFRAVTEVTVFAPDERGLFARITGALAVAGASIVDARIFTTLDGMALDTFWVQDDDNAALADKTRLQRLIEVTEKALTGDLDLEAEIAARRRSWQRRQHVLPVEPRVLIDNKASSKHTVIEINAPDRLGLLYDLTQALTDLGLSIVTARIATYGERAVDAFYVRDTYGLKTTHDKKTAEIKARLLAVIGAATHSTPKVAGAAR